MGPSFSETFSKKKLFDTARGHLFREYLRENEHFSKTILACLSGAQVDWIHEKNAKKSRDSATLKERKKTLVMSKSDSI